MNRYLLMLSIGPVQDFIAAARRTRDLWFGSYLLSEISKAAAKSIPDSEKRLIFPNSDSDKFSEDLKRGSSFNVANVILAEVNADNGEQVKEIAKKAQEAANARWGEFVDEVFNNPDLQDGIDADKWKDQKRTRVIEFYSAWCPFENESDYKNARQKAARLLAARKNLRDFEEWRGETDTPKSSLDGRRESVRKDNREVFNKNGVRIKKGEALDLVGWVKRAAGGNKSFPSVVNIALDPWIRGLKKNSADMTKLWELCDKLVGLHVLSNPKSANDFFPYDATALLPSRYHDFVEDASEEHKAEVTAITGKMKQAMRELHEFYKPMDPYLAVLVADGDKIGKVISTIGNSEEHREFSKTLSRFAGNARDIVERNFGCCVYTGGDDVLAFLPVDKAIPCARELRNEFVDLWKEREDWSFKDSQPTLSVGISIGHALENLEDLLEFARDAEKLAKKASAGKSGDDRNGLAIMVRARGNSELYVREQWKDFSDPERKSLAELSLDQRMEFWVRCFIQKTESIPSKFPYELWETAKFYKDWEDENLLNKAMESDVLRILGRKDITLKKDDKNRVKEYVESAIKGSHDSIKRLADELFVAQWIGTAHTAQREVNDYGDF